MASIERAREIGADVMRVVGSSLMFRNQPHQPQLERLTRCSPTPSRSPKKVVSAWRSKTTLISTYDENAKPDHRG